MIVIILMVNIRVHPTYHIVRFGASCNRVGLGASSGTWIQERPMQMVFWIANHSGLACTHHNQGRRETTLRGGGGGGGVCVHWIARIYYFYKIAQILLDALTTTCDVVWWVQARPEWSRQQLLGGNLPSLHLNKGGMVSTCHASALQYFTQWSRRSHWKYPLESTS